MLEITTRRWMGWIIGAGFFLVPIACSSWIVDSYTPVKWLVVGLIAAIALALAAGSSFLSQPCLIQIPRVGGLGIPALVAGVLYGLSFLANWPGSFENHLLDALTGLALAWLSYGVWQSSESFGSVISRFNLAGTLLVLLYGALQWQGHELFWQISHNSFPSSFFGFQNMTAEFMGISILIQLSALRRENLRKPLVTASLVLVLGLSIGYLSLLSCRSVDLALALTLIPWIFLRGPSLNRILSGLAFLAVAFMLIAVSVSQTPATSPSSQSAQSLQSLKQDNATVRKIRWHNTWAMALARPIFGVGPGNFEFGYLPFRSAWQEDPESHEGMVVRSPHNGYLEAMAESGLPFGVLVAVVLWMTIVMLHQKANASGEPHDLLAASIFLFIAIDAVFAFPMENAFPFFAAAVFAGYACFRLQSRSLKLGKISTRALLVSGFLLVATGNGFFIFSKAVERNFRDESDLVQLACDLFPSNWRNCIQLAHSKLLSEDFDEGVQILDGVLRRQPSNFIAIRYAAYAYMELSRTDEACKLLAKYDGFFAGASSMHDLRQKFCTEH